MAASLEAAQTLSCLDRNFEDGRKYCKPENTSQPPLLSQRLSAGALSLSTKKELEPTVSFPCRCSRAGIISTFSVACDGVWYTVVLNCVLQNQRAFDIYRCPERDAVIVIELRVGGIQRMIQQRKANGVQVTTRYVLQTHVRTNLDFECDYSLCFR